MIRDKHSYLLYKNEDKKALELTRNIYFEWLFNDIWRFQRNLRRTEYWFNCKNGIVNKVIYYMLALRTKKLGTKLGFSIPINVFGKGLSIAHTGTIVVNSNARVGDYCRIHVCVNIGADISDGTLAPCLGDNIYIGPGAKIYSNIAIGDNTVIGANSVVNKSFTDGNCTIAGIPAKKIKDVGKDVIRETSV
ncbi:serine O-acetyltransferase [Vibrio sp. RC27]